MCVFSDFTFARRSGPRAAASLVRGLTWAMRHVSYAGPVVRAGGFGVPVCSFGSMRGHEPVRCGDAGAMYEPAMLGAQMCRRPGREGNQPSSLSGMGVGMAGSQKLGD